MGARKYERKKSERKRGEEEEGEEEEYVGGGDKERRKNIVRKGRERIIHHYITFIFPYLVGLS